MTPTTMMREHIEENCRVRTGWNGYASPVLPVAAAPRSRRSR
jgi:hypothetical protein